MDALIKKYNLTKITGHGIFGLLAAAVPFIIPALSPTQKTELVALASGITSVLAAITNTLKE